MESLSHWTQPAAAALGTYLPRAAAVLSILLLAWLGARLAAHAVRRAGEAAALDARARSPGLTRALASAATAAVWLLALPALLETVSLEGLLTPVNAMLSRLLGFLPALLGAVVVGGAGLLLARMAAQLVAGLARAAGSERLAERLGMATALGPSGLSGLAGHAVFALLLLPVALAALQPLGLDAVTTPLSRLLDTALAFVPRLLSALVVVGLAALVGRVLSTLLVAALSAAGFNRLPARLGLRWRSPPGARQPADWAGLALMTAVLLAALTQACELLGLPVLTATVAQIGQALLRLALAAVVFVAGLALAAAAARRIDGVEAAVPPAAGPGASTGGVWPGESPVAGPAPALPTSADTAAAAALAGAAPHRQSPRAAAARAAIVVFAGALALYQAGLPPAIVTIAFGALAGALALGAAVAIGIGGGPVAARLIERALAAWSRPPAGQPGQDEA